MALTHPEGMTCRHVDTFVWVVIDEQGPIHVGRIELLDGAFLAYDGTGRFLGAFESLDIARRRVETAPRKTARHPVDDATWVASLADGTAR